MAFSSILHSPIQFPLPGPHQHHRRRAPFFTAAAIPPLAAATELASVYGNLDSAAIAVIGGGSVAAVAAALSLADPERRRQLQAEEVGGGDKEVVREYFNNDGFQRWRRIYGETDDVNKVQRDIRLGHSKTVENVMKMLLDEGPLSGVTAKEELFNGKDELPSGLVLPKFEVKDLESLDGKYNTVVCLDVLIHYPQNKADAMIAHLTSLAESRLILSFAPKTFYYDLLKRVGELFPGPSKATRAYLHAEADVERALKKVGWKIRKRDLITTQFYFSRVVEAIPAQ
ncbi:Magnesium protoporphyrin IX methyltransferase-chloroplastic [Striga hermonthica]|uniref:Magnesium protoporphyrin IX methyltransferase-chloroplastic n=1 Tax=Striga hermonthica TaxID=68872 RepID=A0A9N7MHN5_STRHE|nr:Magnesium protoporphyrin IX methyltransferase-chloroplastic [Striga hermonthica]